MFKLNEIQKKFVELALKVFNKDTLTRGDIKTLVKDHLNIDSRTSRCLCLKLLLECKHFINIVISKQSVSLVNDK